MYFLFKERKPFRNIVKNKKLLKTYFMRGHWADIELAVGEKKSNGDSFQLLLLNKIFFRTEDTSSSMFGVLLHIQSLIIIF